MGNKSTMISAREEYINLIRGELLGPGSEISIPDKDHELLTTSPEKRYSIGILFPKNNKMNADNDDEARGDEGEIKENTEKEIEIDEEQKSEDNFTNPDKWDEDEDREFDEENLEEEISLATQNMPSSMGMIFFIDGNADKINCNVKFATYRPSIKSDCRIPFYPFSPESYSVPYELSSYIIFDRDEKCLKLVDGTLSGGKIHDIQKHLKKDEFGIISAMYKLVDQLKNGYIRIPHDIKIELDMGDEDYIDNNKELDGTKLRITALRRRISKDIYSVTIMLVNDEIGQADGKNCIFQPEICIDTEANNFRFKEYSGVTDFDILDDEEKSLELQYRNKRSYGTGLGTAINWKINEIGHGILYNDFFPEVEVPFVDFRLPKDTDVNEITLSMKYLSDLNSENKELKIQHLISLVEAYGTWIDELIKKKDTLLPKYIGIAEKNIAGCKVSYKRMMKGIESLKENTNIWIAFQLANRAMYMQRVHLKLQESMTSRYPDDNELADFLINIDYNNVDEVFEDKYSWRPFQLAFLLMSINSVTSDDSPEREIVDLIWFPTGGGKTEAYLGLTAFTIFYRRLVHSQESNGTAVIMRYTLRLLAAQQFTRASTLICACEYIRSDAVSPKSKYGVYPLGRNEISIGLWIGGEHTPNKNQEAKKCVDKLQKVTVSNIREFKEKYNKFQVLKCPWCGTRMVKERDNGHLIGEFGYQMRNGNHFEMFCPQDGCYFHNHLPIQVVDDELYKKPPTLLFGTVDKFAMLPWNNNIGNFFGINHLNRAPELIIQDELHLISGPLGTMVGLYETAIDALCQSKGVNTKIVASTATIRRAVEQCSALYNRKVNQFPHPGLDAEDSFFSRESVIDYSKEVFGRKYIGLMPAGKTKAMMEIRTIVALLQEINTMQLSDEIKDKYWTLVIYFNSLRDLGKCSNRIDDDVKDFIKRMAYRLGTSSDARKIARSDELTSRVTTTELNETLDKLEKVSYCEERIRNKQYPFPSNVLLATNMISVGIDIARLNVMLLVGQPKLTSEYIQASSRVGRSFPGVVFTMYDGSKSRDRSHYEQFRMYHESFYKYVEPTGVTPFSKPARLRALHAVVIALLRMLETELSDEKGAGQFTVEKYKSQIGKIKQFIIERNNTISCRLNPDMDNDSKEIEKEIDYIVEEWECMAKNSGEGNFYYGEKYMFSVPDSSDSRLLKVFNSSSKDSAFDTMTSMRNVDTMVAGNILQWEDR